MRDGFAIRPCVRNSGASECYLVYVYNVFAFCVADCNDIWIFYQNIDCGGFNIDRVWSI